MNFDGIGERVFVLSFTFLINIYWAVTITWALDIYTQTYSVCLWVSYLTSLEFNNWLYNLQVSFHLTNLENQCHDSFSYHDTSPLSKILLQQLILQIRQKNSQFPPLSPTLFYFPTKISITAATGGLCVINCDQKHEFYKYEEKLIKNHKIS